MASPNENVLKRAAKSSLRAESYSDGIRDMDTPLTDHGRAQAALTGKCLSTRYRIDFAFSSPYLRTVETTKAILEALPAPPQLILEERIRELEFGTIDGLTWEAVKIRYPDEYARRQREGK